MTRKQKVALIHTTMRRLLPILFLDQWRIGLDVYDSRAELKKATGDDFSAGAYAEPEYAQGRLGFVLEEWNKREELELTILHELLHVSLFEATAVMDRWAGDDAEKKETARMTTERITNHMTRVVGNLLGMDVAGIVQLRKPDLTRKPIEPKA
jgi:hypothetical protein